MYILEQFKIILINCSLRDIQLAQQSKIQALEKTLQLKNSQWETKESEYKKAVKQLEKKVYRIDCLVRVV